MIRLLAVWLLLVGSALVHIPALATPSASEDLSAFKELQQSKWEAQKELQQKDIEALRQQIAAVDKRVDDQLTQVGQAVDRFGVLVAVLGVVVTVLLVFGGFLGYRNAKTEATADAKEAATAEAKKTAISESQSSAEKWFKSKAVALTEQIAELEKKASQAQAQIHAQLQGVVAHAGTTRAEMNEAKEKTHAALQLVQESIGNQHLKSSPAQEDAKRTLAQRDQELKATNEDSYSFDDWDTRAHAAYGAAKLEDAAHFWLKAARVPNAGAVNVAQVLLNRGITLSQLNQPEAAITTYDEVLNLFGEAAEPDVREQVAKALVSKGLVQGKLEQQKAEITTYDDVLRRFGEATEPTLREQVAKALVNKGEAQGRLKQHEVAITTFDEVLRRFGEATEPRLREQAAYALFNKGNAQGRLGQHEAAISTYEEGLRRFDAANESYLLEPMLMGLNGFGFVRLVEAKILGPNTPGGQGMLRLALNDLNRAVDLCKQSDGTVLGNRSYVQCLLGQMASAESDFASALRAQVNGGKYLYKGTLNDLEISPVSEDATMRALVERAWIDFNSKGD